MRVLTLILLTCVGLQGQNGEYITKIFDSESGSLNYNIMYPHDFDENKKFPLMLFLHGAGERGSDNKAQLIHGSKFFQDSLAKYPAIVVFPQCTKDDYWVDLKSEGQGKGRKMEVMPGEPNPGMAKVIALVNNMLTEKYIDPSRFYVAGLSMGGMGTMELAWRMPGKIAAAIAICGVGPRERAADMKPVPFWFFHGIDDNVVPSRYSVQMLRAMQVSGGKAKITLYTDTNHNSWDKAFADPDFLPFLFSKSKS